MANHREALFGGNVRYWVVKTAREDTSYKKWFRKNGLAQPEGTNHHLVNKRPGRGDRCFYWSTAPTRSLRAMGRVTKTDSVRGWKLRAFIKPVTGEFTAPLSLEQLRVIPLLAKQTFLNSGYPATFYSLEPEIAELLYQLAVAANPLYSGTWNDVPNRSRRSAAAWKLMAPLNASMDASIAAPNRAADKRRPALLAVRAGQTKFRRMLFGAAGMRCEVTGCDIPGLLDACHVKGYGQSGKYSLDNGLLLRKDIHALLDRGLLRIQPTTQRLIVDRSIAKSDYARLKGKRLAPRLNGDRVSERALNHLWKRAMNAARA